MLKALTVCALSFLVIGCTTMRAFLLLLCAAGVLFSQVANAATYEVDVTRKGSNVYRVDGKDIIIQTRYCYVYAYSEEALLRPGGYGGEIIFIGSKEKCDVKTVFGKASPKPGKYTVRVTHESDDWYEVEGTDFYIQTSMCLTLALGVESFLTINAGAYGRIVFDNGQSCTVDGVYTKLKLD